MIYRKLALTWMADPTSGRQPSALLSAMDLPVLSASRYDCGMLVKARHHFQDAPRPHRVGAFLLAYGVYFACLWCVPVPAFHLLDHWLPGAFYHLQEGEELGPIGDPNVVLAFVGIDYVVLLAVFLPSRFSSGLPAG